MNTSFQQTGLSSVALFLVLVFSTLSCSPSFEEKGRRATIGQNTTVAARTAAPEEYPSGKPTEEVRARVEEGLWQKCQDERTHAFYDQYLKEYPNGKYAQEAQEALKTFEALDLKSAKEQDTAESWEAFLDKYPRGTNVSYAREALDLLLFQQASGLSSDAQALEDVFKRCKTPAVADKVFKMWDNATWNSAKGEDSASAYRDYLLRFPGGAHVKEAKMSIEDAIWRTCQQTGKAESYEQYLKEYSRGKHADEARKALDGLAYERVKEKDTVEAYEEFMKNHRGDDSARKRLRQLRYERAVKTGTLENWIAFYDKYRHSRWQDDGKKIEQMKENASKEIERLLYERIVAQPTLELCRDYLSRYRDGAHKQQVKIKMEPCLFDEALRTNKLDTYFKYLEEYPDGHHDSEVRKRVDALVFKTLDEKENFSSFDRYLRLSPKNKDVLLAHMEPLMFDWAKRVNTVESYDKYLSRYPDGAHLKEVQARMDPVLFKKAEEEDWYSTYEEYIEKYPNGQNVQKARDRIAYLKANKAIVEIQYPKVLEQRNSPYWNVSSPFWGWDTVFKEKGGKVGFKIKGSGQITDPRGGRWGHYGGSIGRGEVKVPPGGTGKDDYWCSSSSHAFCNGYAVFTWTGEDAGGHAIRLEEKVKLQHTGCPGPKK